MKKLRTTIIATSLICLSVGQVKSQVTGIGNFMAGSVEDANKLFEAYLSPYVNGFGASLTGGWYNTAKPHKLGGFDITVTFNTAIVPEDNNSFNVNDLGLNSFMLATGADPSSPTISGPQKEGPQLVYDIDGVPEIDAFRLPEGIDNKFVPSPMLQAGVGLIKGTEIMGRWMPTLTYGENSIGMWGVGLKHSIKQWIPVLQRLPVLHLSIMGGYTKLNSTTNITVTPEDIGFPEGSYSIPPSTDFTDQSMDIDVGSFTANLLVSANLPVVCFYGGVGFASTNTSLQLLGDYPVAYADGLTPGVVNDPLDIEIKNQDGGITKPRLNAGIRFKFAVVTLHFDYTYANYSVATAGLGISFR